jgi:hypothetical protein
MSKGRRSASRQTRRSRSLSRKRRRQSPPERRWLGKIDQPFGRLKQDSCGSAEYARARPERPSQCRTLSVHCWERGNGFGDNRFVCRGDADCRYGDNRRVGAHPLSIRIALAISRRPKPGRNLRPRVVALCRAGRFAPIRRLHAGKMDSLTAPPLVQNQHRVRGSTTRA